MPTDRHSRWITTVAPNKPFQVYKSSWLTQPLVLMTIALLSLLFVTETVDARRKVEQYNLPTPQSYEHHELRVEASSYRPEVGKPVTLKAIVNPSTPSAEIEYQFLINGAPIPEPGMHKVHIFKETGTYKVTAVAKLGGSYLLNSPPIILHVIDSWIAPEAVISPAVLNVQSGEDAVFTSHSETDPESRQWRYWSISSGHRGSGEKFVIKTDNLNIGKYPIELLVKDDRNRESITNAYLVIHDADSDVETLTLNADGELESTQKEGKSRRHSPLQLRSSHTHRLENMLIVFWIQNAQPGADTQLQLDSGDGNITSWSKKLRYGHRYEHFGIYTSKILSSSPLANAQSNSVTVYVWPLWLPVIMVILGLLLAGIPFFRRHSQQELTATPPSVHYAHHVDSGQYQLILTSDTETPAITIKPQTDNGLQTLTETVEISKDHD